MKVKSLAGRLSILFIGFLFLVSVSVAATFWGLDAQNKDALVINLAGRQRMLIQQMSRLSLVIELREEGEEKIAMGKAISDFEQTLYALRDGGAAPYLSEKYVELPGVSSPTAILLLNELYHSWNIYKANLQTVISSDPGEGNFAAAVASIEQISPSLIQQADGIVRWFETAAEQKVARLKWFQLIFLISALVWLAGGSLSTLKSVIQPMKELSREAIRIGEGDLITPVRSSGPAEIKALGVAFDAMRAGLKESRDEIQSWTETLELKVSRRTQELQALNEVCREISAYLDINSVLDSVTEKSRQLLMGEAAFLCLLDSQEKNLKLQATSGPVAAVQKVTTAADGRLPSQILSSEKALLCGLKEGCGGCELMATGYRSSHVAAPLRAGDRVIGALCVGTSQSDYFSSEDRVLLTRLADGAATALVNARLYQQAERAAILEERQSLAAEMHDGLAQTLSFVMLMVDLAQEQVKEIHLEEAASTLERSRQALDQATSAARVIIDNLQQDLTRQTILQNLLSSVTEECAQQFTQNEILIESISTYKAPLRIPRQEAEHIMRIVREAILNAQKHSLATKIQVDLQPENGSWVVSVIDDGIGFIPGNLTGDAERKHFGLSIMRARADRIGGTIEIDSSPGGGTKVVLSWPSNGTQDKGRPDG